MALFHQIPDAFAILLSRGVYKQADMFERNGMVYAKHGGGFIGLRKNMNGTTTPNVSWTEIEGLVCYWDDLGRLYLPKNLRRVA